MKNIWYRGCILIVKKFKYMRRIDQRRGKWLYNGFKQFSKQLLEMGYNNWESYLDQSSLIKLESKNEDLYAG